MEEYIKIIKENRNKIKELTDEINLLHKSTENAIKSFFITAIRKYGIERNGYIELDLPNLIIDVYSHSYAQDEDKSYLRHKVYIKDSEDFIEVCISRLSLPVKSGLVNEPAAAHLISEMSGCNPGCAYVYANEILMDVFHKRGGEQITPVAKKMSFSQGFHKDVQIHFMDILNNHLKEKHDEK